VVEPAVGAKSSQERLLERVLCPLRSESPPDEAEDLVPVLLVEAFERRYAHGLHHLRQTRSGADL
jgi:hypothetical protein